MTSDGGGVMDIDLWHTRNMLDRMQAEQERLHDQLEASGLTTFVDRSEWLLDHRPVDEVTAWGRRWRALGVGSPEPREPRFVRGPSLSVRPLRRVKCPPVIPPWRQLEIAIAALAAQDAAEAAESRAA